MSIKSPRLFVLDLLNKMEKGAFSNLVLDSSLKVSDFSERDKGFVSRLFYGVLERKITLEYVISAYSSKPLHKLDATVVNILKIGLYQLLYMDAVPDNAAVNESVNLIKKSVKSSASGFVNAILRNFIRDGKKIKYPTDKVERLGIEYSCNKELASKLCSEYSFELAENLLSESLNPHKTFLRVNTLKTSDNELINLLASEGISADKSEILEGCLVTDKLGSVEKSKLFADGYFHIQDLSSQLCCKCLAPVSGETIIDICAAPGGKTFTIAEMMNNNGVIIAGDLHEKRVNLIRNSAEKLGINIINAVKNDAKVFNDSFPMADKVLCDVSCSGFGVIRSKPEIKYTELDTISKLPQIQYEILKTASGYLKKGGELVYSTCTINREENDMIIDKFLEENSDFEPVDIFKEYSEFTEGHKMTIFPKYFGCEGFFISKIRKVE